MRTISSCAETEIELSLALPCHFQPRLSLMQCVQRALDVDVGVTAGEALLGSFFRFAGALHVNFRRTLGGFGQDRNFIREHFGESPGYRKPLLFVGAGVESYFAD